MIIRCNDRLSYKNGCIFIGSDIAKRNVHPIKYFKHFVYITLNNSNIIYKIRT